MPYRCGSPYPGRLGLPVWALPRSLAATRGIDVSFSSWGYLDVSVHPVPFQQAIDSPVDTCALPQVRSRIRRSVDITDMCSSPQLIAACHVLLRLPVPRHPPYALSNLTKLSPAPSVGQDFGFTIVNLVKCLVISVEIVRIYPNSLSSLIYFRFLTNTLDFSFLICFHSFIQFSRCVRRHRFRCPYAMVENRGLEPLTPCVQGRCSPS